LDNQTSKAKARLSKATCSDKVSILFENDPEGMNYAWNEEEQRQNEIEYHVKVAGLLFQKHG